MPWDHRQMGIASASEVPTSPRQLSNQAVGLLACVNSDCDCGDFSSWEQAHVLLQSVRGDPHRLDGDGDGVACDGLR
jgi:micrococcal nuclease